MQEKSFSCFSIVRRACAADCSTTSSGTTLARFLWYSMARLIPVVFRVSTFVRQIFRLSIGAAFDK